MIYRAIDCKREWDTELLVNSQGRLPSLSLDNAQASEAEGVVSLDMVLSCGCVSSPQEKKRSPPQE